MKKIFILGIAMFIIQDLSAQKLNRSQLPKAGPAPVIAFKDPSNFQLPNGITVLVVEDHKLPKISASYLIDRGPSTEGDKAGVLSLMGSMLNEGTQNKTKLQFNQAVDLMGATVDLRSTGGSVSALTRYFEPAFMLMSEALRQPALHQDAFDKLKAQSLTGLKSNELNAQAISGRMVNALAYGKTHPMGEFVTQQSLEFVTLDDIKKAYISAITPSRGILTIVGDIDPAVAKKIVMKALGDWKGVDLQLPELPLVSNPGATEIDVVDVKNAVQTEITAVSLVNLPMKSEDYHAVLLANQILGGGADAKLFRNLREKHGYTYGAYSRIGAGRFQSTFAANAAVRTEKTDSAIVEMLHEINIMRTEKVDGKVLQNAKNLYNGSFALGLENPGRTAAFASEIQLNDLSKDFYRTYLQKINAVTPDDILRVSQKYFGRGGIRVVVVGNSKGFSAGLSRLGYAVKKFDSYGAPMD